MTLDVGSLATGTISAGVTIARNTVFVPTNGVAQSLVGAGAAYLIAYRLPS